MVELCSSPVRSRTKRPRLGRRDLIGSYACDQEFDDSVVFRRIRVICDPMDL